MADILQNAMTALPLFLPHRNVTYRQGGVAISLSVIVGKSMVEGQNTDGLRWKMEMRNYLIEPGELVIGTTEIKPQEGDTITDDGEGTTKTYIVAGDGMVAWRWSSRYHKLIRVNVTERSEVAV